MSHRVLNRKGPDEEDFELLDGLVASIRLRDVEQRALQLALQELRSLRRSAEAINQALNEGDGVYRP